MSAAIAILTYRRRHALETLINSLRMHCPDAKIAVFEDCGNDETEEYLRQGASAGVYDHELIATRYDGFDYTAYIGERNLGVAGNSNRAIRWFETRTDCDQLVLCNDDVEATGDFPAVYAAAHKTFGVGLFCFCDFTAEEYLPVKIRHKGRVLHVLPRMTGMAMSLTRETVVNVGYFEASVFGRFGEEHVFYTHRVRQAGLQTVNGAEHPALDIPGVPLHHQEVASSIRPDERPELDAQATAAGKLAAARMVHMGPYRPFDLGVGKHAGAYAGAGIPTSSLVAGGYTVIDGYARLE